jgi:hypothetical protein
VPPDRKTMASGDSAESPEGALSNGDDKPGLKDIGNLKARLGMLSKAKAEPAAPAPQPSVATSPFAEEPRAVRAPAVDLTAGGDVELGADTAIVRIEAPPPAPAPAPKAPAPAPKAPAPAPSLGLGEDLFSRPAPQAAPPVDKRAEQAAAAARFAAEDAARKAAEPPPNVEFAHPLQRGNFQEAQASVNLSAEEEAVLNSFEGSQRGVKLSFALTLTGVVGVLLLGFGFIMGDVRSSRRLVNAQIDASIRVRELMLPHLDRLQEVAPIIAAMSRNPEAVDWERVKMLPDDLTGVSPSILSHPVPLDKDLVNLVGRSVIDINALFTAIAEHKLATLRRDKAELESLMQGDEFFTKYQQFAVYSPPAPFDPKAVPVRSNRPQDGRVVALSGEATVDEATGEAMIPVRYRKAEDDKNVMVRGLVLLPKNDLLSSGGGNVQTLYTLRVKALAAQTKKLLEYEKGLREVIEAQASREKVFSF